MHFKVQNKNDKRSLYVLLLIPWPIAVFSLSQAFYHYYSVILSAISVGIGAVIVIYYQKKIGSIIDDEIQSELKNKSSIKESEADDSNKSKRNSGFVQGFKIISIIYAAVAGLAITQAMNDFSSTECGLPDTRTITESVPCFEKVTSLEQLPYLLTNDHMLLLVSFFIIGTAFYHCGILFLYPRTVKFVGDQNPKLATANCLILFAESVFLFFAATSADAIERFSLWIILLLSFDTAWCLLNFLYKDKPELIERRLRAKKQLNALFAGWADIEGLLLMFFVVTSIFITFQGTNIEEGSWIHVTLLLVSMVAIVAIYQIGWEWFWTKFQTEDER